MITAVIGAALIACGVVMALLLAFTDLDVATVIVAGFAAMFAVITGAGLLGLALARAADRRAALRRDQFDDAIAMVTGPSDAEIEQMISNFPKGDGRG